MKTTLKLRLSFLAMFLIWGNPLMAASVGISVAKTQAANGQDVMVPVSLKAAPNIGSMQLDLAYDPTVLQFDKIENGPLAADNCLVESNGKESGRLRLALISKDGINGDGVLINAHFKVLGQSGSKSALTPQSVRVWQIPKGHESMAGMNHLIDVNPTVEAGEVSVPASFPQWLWIALGALGLILLLMMALRKGSKKAGA